MVFASRRRVEAVGIGKFVDIPACAFVQQFYASYVREIETWLSRLFPRRSQENAVVTGLFLFRRERLVFRPSVSTQERFPWWR